MRLFIQYQNSDPVQIDASVGRGPQKLLPLENVADLIQAYKAAVVPLPFHPWLAQLSLKLPVGVCRTSLSDVCFSSGDENDTTLEMDVSLSLLDSLGSDSRKPLIIHSKQQQEKLDLFNYLLSIPPSPIYGNIPGPSTTYVSDQRLPSLVPWDNFFENVQNWVSNIGIQYPEVHLSPPIWIHRRVSREESELHPFIFDNILNPVVKPFPDLLFSNYSEGPSVICQPDFILSKNGSLQTLIEIKGKWSVPSELNIHLHYERNRYVMGAINQLFSYLVLNHRNSGILSNYEMTWFFERRIEENGEENFYVSDGVIFNRQGITLFQSIAYFINNIANDTEFQSPPPSRKSSPRQLQKSKSQNMIQSPLHQSFSVDDISVGGKIGEGRTGTVFLADSNLTALKTLDISKRPQLVPEMINEVSIYSKLQSLQGKIIPTFRYSGIIEDVLFVIGLDYVGKVPSQLNTIQKEKLLSGLTEIHSLGVLHGDVRLENIVIDSIGNPFIIDFALASLEFNSEKLNEEFELFYKLVYSL